MGKRKNEHDEEYFRRKIQRYENKLKKKRKEQSPSLRSNNSSPCDAYQSSVENYNYANSDEENTPHEPQEDNQIPLLQSTINTALQDASQIPPLPQEQTSGEPSVINETSTVDISTEILDLLGEAKKLDPALGEKILNEVAERWGKILLDGLDKDHKESLKAKILAPVNFTLVRAPKLNLELASILPESSKNRDKHLESAQNQLGTRIAGLVNLTKDLIQAQSVDKLEIIKRISEISQLLLDLHHELTFNRRKLVIPLLDKNFWNLTKGIKRDDFLFGTTLSENIKNSKDIERTGLQIKKPTPVNTRGNRRTSFQAGNARGPLRRANNATATPSTSRYQPQPSTFSAKRTNYPTQRSRQAGANKVYQYDKKNRR